MVLVPPAVAVGVATGGTVFTLADANKLPKSKSPRIEFTTGLVVAVVGAVAVAGTTAATAVLATGGANLYNKIHKHI